MVLPPRVGMGDWGTDPKTRDGPGADLTHAERAENVVAAPGSGPAVTPDLRALLQDPARVAEMPPEAIPGLLCHLAALQSALTARLLAASTGNGQPGPAAEDRLLTVKEAAEKLGVSEDWLYRKAGKLPFTVRLGSRQVRFSERGIEKYIRQRQGR